MPPQAYDLHFHSAASDGAAIFETVCSVVQQRPFLRWVGLADHDTIEYSVRLAQIESRALVAFETVAPNGRGSAEFVGLRVAPDNADLCAYLANRRLERTLRFDAWITKLRALGFRV